MDNKKIIVIAIIILIIVGGILFVVLTSQNYERVEITPNGTTIEIPANKTKFDGDIESVKVWNWDKGLLVTYNSYEDDSLIRASEMGFNSLNKIVTNGEKQNIDGFTCYVINADELLEVHVFSLIKVNYNGKFYCIPLSNQTTHDNILICCKDKDIAVHMAKSVEYKNVYHEKPGLNKTLSKVENMTDDLKSKASDLANNTNLSGIQSTIEDKTGLNLNDAKSKVEQYTGKLPI